MPRQLPRLAVFTAIALVSPWIWPATPVVAQAQQPKLKGELRKYNFDKSNTGEIVNSCWLR
jgi:hypothetical protein